MACKPMTKSVANGKPMLSNKMPAKVGPMKAPRANVDVQRPDMSP